MALSFHEIAAYPRNSRKIGLTPEFFVSLKSRATRHGKGSFRSHDAI
jgi:hypothetical protein